MSSVIIIFLSYFISFFSALLIVAIGELFSEKSGVINIALEAIMSFSVMVGILIMNAITPFFSPILVVAITLISAIISGGLFSLLLAIPAVKYGVNQTLIGNAINMLAYAIVIIITKRLSAFSTSVVQFNRDFFMMKVGIFNFSIFSVISFLVLIISYFLLKCTIFGFRLASCGENPYTASNSGLNVIKYRYIGVLISGILAGIAGLAFIIPTGSYWDATNGVYGFGFLAISVVIFGLWKIERITLSALFFSFFLAFSYCYEGIFSEFFGIELNKDYYVTNNLFMMLPYLLCLILLIFVSKKNVSPKSLGKPYIENK